MSGIDNGKLTVLHAVTRSAVAAAMICACHAPQRAVDPEHVALPAVLPVPAGAQVIPTRYVTDRFFATPVTARGDTVTLFLDTGDSGRLFAAAAAGLGLTTDSVGTAKGYHQMSALPEFRADRSIPGPTPSPGIGVRIIVTAPTDAFDTLMARNAAGQLGQQWFWDRIWTFDYLHHRLLMLAQSPHEVATGAHQISFDFATDKAGRRLSLTPRLPATVDGDSLILLFDTGATVWLTDRALAQLNDGLPPERASSLVRQTIFTKWHQRHPEWRFVEHANRVNGADMIEVPTLRIADFDVGPVWFAALPDAKWPAVIPINMRIDGTVGGSALKYFTVTVDYPQAVAQFSR